jgi:diacylglycerol kinase family enzyme
MGKLKFALFSSRHIYEGTHIGKPGIGHHRCDAIKIELLNQDASEQVLLDVDGEPLGKLPLEVELIPGALEVFVPG